MAAEFSPNMQDARRVPFRLRFREDGDVPVGIGRTMSEERRGRVSGAEDLAGCCPVVDSPVREWTATGRRIFSVWIEKQWIQGARRLFTVVRGLHESR